MANEFKREWTEADVRGLIGQSESIRREFKSGKMFDEEEGKWIKALSKEISVLANTEGGELILGIDEDRKSKPKKAEKVDGVPGQHASERFQDLVLGNVFPSLLGVHFKYVPLRDMPDRVVVVIQIPQGSTAYQAKDGLYYGRNEFRCDDLPDHEIRLRMNRGRVARASVCLRVQDIELGVEHESSVLKENAAALQSLSADQENATEEQLTAMLYVSRAQEVPDKMTFALVLRNDGELTIRDPAIEVREVDFQGGGLERELRVSGLRPRIHIIGEVLYPGEEREIGGPKFTLSCGRDVSLAEGNCILDWKVFLDNSPPSTDKIDVGAEFQRRRSEGPVVS